MQPGGTRQAVLVAAALAASAVLAAWWWSQQRDAATAFPRPVRAEIADRATAAPVRTPVAVSDVGSKPTPAPAASTAVATTTSSPEPKSMLPSTADDAAATASPPPDSKDGRQAGADDTKSPSPAAEENASDENGVESPPPAGEEEAPGAVQPDDAGTADGEAAPAGDASDAAAAPGSAIDAEKAADLIARHMADLDTAEQADSEDARVQHEFESRDGGGDAERHVEEALRKGITDWIAGLPADEAAGLMLMSVECRVGQCRILMAQAHYGAGPETTPEDRQHATELIGAFDALASEPWWIALGLHAGRSVAFPAGDGSGMGLWIQYETMTNAPAPPAGGA